MKALLCQDASYIQKPPRAFGLFIGINQYDNEGQLENAVAGAQNLAIKMQRLSSDSNTISVIPAALGGPLNKMEIEDMLTDLYSELERSDSKPEILIFYYAGHGFNFNGHDYIISSKFKRDPNLLKMQLEERRRECFELKDLMKEINKKVGNQTEKYIFIDACREHLNFQGVQSNSFCQYDGSLPDNTFLIFSTECGKKSSNTFPLSDVLQKVFQPTHRNIPFRKLVVKQCAFELSAGKILEVMRA